MDEPLNAGRKWWKYASRYGTCLMLKELGGD
jgi:hypothetical protein